MQLLLVIGFCSSVLGIQPIKLEFNGKKVASYVGDVDGPWPTIPVYYGNSSEHLDCYLSLWNQSVFISPQSCGVNFTCDGQVLPNSYYPNIYYTMKYDPTPATTTINFATMNDGSDHSKSSEDYTFMDVMHVNGFGYEHQDNISISSLGNGTHSFLVSTNGTIRTGDFSVVLPWLMSTISLSGDGDFLNNMGNTNPMLYRSFGLHLGSVEPWVDGSLYLGGFDTNHILGPLSSFTSLNLLRLVKLSIGVETGYFPLKSLALSNGSFVQGPITYTVADLTTSTSNNTDKVGIEPSLPYLHLPRKICDALADELDLKYDITRNIYLWSKNVTDPIFQSPSFLEIELGIDDGAATITPLSSIKIPFLSLYNTYQASVKVNGTVLPPAPYFPCSPTDTNSEHVTPTTLGRAFLQSAFLGAIYQQGENLESTIQYLIGQAPGPANSTEVVVANYVGKPFPTWDTSMTANAWTKSWDSLLMPWTSDANSTTLESNKTVNSSKLEREDVGIGLGSTIGGILLVVGSYFAVRQIHRERRKWTRIRTEIAEEDELARKFEREDMEKQKDEKTAEGLGSSVLKAPQPSDPEQTYRSRKAPFKSADESDRTFRIPRKPVASMVQLPSRSQYETDTLLEEV